MSDAVHILLGKEENEYCRRHKLPDFSLRRYTINRYADEDISSTIYYIQTELVAGTENSSQVWTTDILQHDHEPAKWDDVCDRCKKLSKIYQAQCEFVAYIEELDDTNIKDTMTTTFKSQSLASSVFGGYPRVFFKKLRHINDVDRIIVSPFKR